MFLLRKRFWLTVLKVLVLAVVARMMLLQAPELRYDLGPKRPVTISGPEDLASGDFGPSTFVAVTGTPDFEQAISHGRYGVVFNYFHLREYDTALMVRTYEPITEKWTQLDRFLGRLRPFGRQPFLRGLRRAYREEFDIEMPAGSYVLFMDDVPRLDGWQVGAVAFSGVLWLLMFYLFFLRRWAKAPLTPPA